MPGIPRPLGAASERISRTAKRRLLVLGFVAFSAPGRAPASSESGQSPASAGPHSFANRFGVQHLAASLQATSPAERLRGIRRLAALDSDTAAERLASFAVERGASLGGRELLALTRALALRSAGAKRELALASLMSQRTAEDAEPEQAALLELVRATAALGLASSGSAGGLEVLARALRAGGPAAAVAAGALEAYPPRELGPLLAAPGEPTIELARLLGKLGDQRAFHALRGWVRGESAEVRAAAAIALTELGAMETVPLARQWLAQDLPVLHDAALQILMLAQAPEAAAELARQLVEQPSDPAARGRMLAYPSAELTAAILAQPAHQRDVEPWNTLLGRIGGPAAVRGLGAAQARPGAAFSATHALSRLPGPEAHAALVEALDHDVALSLTVRAVSVRERLWQERFRALPGHVAALLRSEVPMERAAGAWASALTGNGAALVELESGDEVRILAASNTALLLGDAVYRRAAALLTAAAPGRIRTALTFCLLRASGRNGVPTAVLRSLIEEGGAARPLALRALAAREDSRLRSYVAAFVAHPDPLLRAHAARGLGDSARPSATAPLASRFEFETDEAVRHAIVCALSARRGRAVRRALELAAGLDPSPRVRSAARLALGGARLGDPPFHDDVLWAEVRSAPAVESADGEAGVVLLNVAPGAAFPVFADPGGILVVPGVGAGQLGIRLQIAASSF
jgi:HEAT repeat protein